MGNMKSIDYCNLHYMSQITRATSADLIEVIVTYLEDFELEKRLKAVEEDDDDTYDSDYVGVNQKGLLMPIPTGVKLEALEDEEIESMEADTMEFRDLNHSVHPKVSVVYVMCRVVCCSVI